MARRRCFSIQIVESDAFLDMPLSTQALYFHLNLNADDEGFVNSPKRIIRMIGAAEDDLKLLLTKRFLIAFDSGVVVVKHWRINNTLQSDRMKRTEYQEERQMIELKSNKAYTVIHSPKECEMDMETKCFQNGSIIQSNLIQSNLTKSNISQSIYPSISKSIREDLTEDQIDRLNELYSDLDGLIHMVDEKIRIRDNKDPIRNAFAYIKTIASNEGWPTAAQAAERNANLKALQDFEDDIQREREEREPLSPEKKTELAQQFGIGQEILSRANDAWTDAMGRRTK